MIRLSAVLSIHNRAELLSHALWSYQWQTLNRRHWEIVVVDDGSTDALESMLREYGRGCNVRLIRMDHTRHPMFRARNPGWAPGQPKDWFHTPALSTNLGVSRARGDVVVLCHPEVVHHEDNFRNAWRWFVEARGREFAFGRCYLGTQSHRPRMADMVANAARRAFPFHDLLCNLEAVDRPPDPGTAEALARSGDSPYHQGAWWFTEQETYWYLSLLPRAAVEAVGGVDFRYLHGVAGEDDDFRERVARAGYPSRARHGLLQGFHQDHSHEPEGHRRRETRAWADGLARNRALLARRRQEGFLPVRANTDYDWTASECLVSETVVSEAP